MTSHFTRQNHWSHLFIPHPQTHQKAHLLSVKALLFYVVFFLFLHFAFTTLPKYQPGILGITSGVDQKELVRLTNEERKKQGLSELSEDSRLNQAAYQKALNMFEEDYWAHYSPSGKDPWGFIQGSGYKFSYAGENLARNFYASDEVVVAWMNSPTHRDNIVNSHYTNIGIAVVEGVLKGQKTILVVQEFGRPVSGLAEAPVSGDSVPATGSSVPVANVGGSNITPQTQTLVASVQKSKELTPASTFSIDPFLLTKVAGMGLIAFLIILIAVDLYIMRRRMIYRVATRHLPQMAVMSVAGSALWNSSAGQVTEAAVKVVIGGGP